MLVALGRAGNGELEFSPLCYEMTPPPLVLNQPTAYCLVSMTADFAQFFLISHYFVEPLYEQCNLAIVYHTGRDKLSTGASCLKNVHMIF